MHPLQTPPLGACGTSVLTFPRWFSHQTPHWVPYVLALTFSPPQWKVRRFADFNLLTNSNGFRKNQTFKYQYEAAAYIFHQEIEHASMDSYQLMRK
jgi:hypothetical protein